MRKQISSWGTLPNGLTFSRVPEAGSWSWHNLWLLGLSCHFSQASGGVTSQARDGLLRPRPLPASTSGLKSESKIKETTVCRSRSRFKSEPVFPGGHSEGCPFLSPPGLPGIPQRPRSSSGAGEGLCSTLGFCLQGWEGGTALGEARSPGSQHESDLAEE